MIEKKVEVASSTNKAVAGAASGIAGTSAILNLSAPASIWSMANQIQICLTLILTGAYIPEPIQDYLSGQTFASFNFDFIPTVDIPYVQTPIKMLNYNNTNEQLKKIGIKSGSSFVNNAGFLFSIIILICIHIFAICLPQFKPKVDESKKRK